jgi:2-hydroxycyclohexanecarboxyl-CoA dehydrogenase
MDFGLQGSVVVVTGGAQGIGRGIVEGFVNEGAKVAIADISQEAAQKAAASITERGGQVLAVPTDVSKLESTNNLIKVVTEHWGKVDVLVHGAAVFSIQRFLDTPSENWDNVIKVSQYGAMNCALSVLPSMIEQKKGRIIYIVSDAGRMGDSFQPIYAGAKAAVIAFGKSIAQDVGRQNITVNMVSPGLTVTNENRSTLEQVYGLGTPGKQEKLFQNYPMRRIGTPDDIAAITLFLSSDRAGFITGQTLSVSGGYCMV